MAKKHYSGKELLYRRQLEKQRQQGEQNTVKQRMQQMNKLKKSVEAAGQDMRQRAREGKDKSVSD